MGITAEYKHSKLRIMKKIFDKISEGLSWLIFAKWYKGGDMGDGILVSLLSGCLFICIAIGVVIYCVYALLW